MRCVLHVFAALHLNEGITTFPDAVNSDGTEQYFSVTVAVGKQYVACWSFGDDTSSVATSMARSRVAPSFVSTEDLLRVRRNFTEKDGPDFSPPFEPEHYMLASLDEISAPAADSKTWFFVSLFSQTGIRFFPIP